MWEKFYYGKGNLSTLLTTMLSPLSRVELLLGMSLEDVHVLLYFFFSFSNQKSELGRGRSHGTKVNRCAGTVLKYRVYIASTEKGLLKTAVEEIERLRK